jgi:hypothetical protein
MMMKGLELAENYFNAYGVPMIQNKFRQYAERIAVGLVGPGSECFGFDDEISRDHDWGPGFCIWLTKEDHSTIGASLQEAYLNLPQAFEGFGPRIVSPGEEARVGVSEITTFYKRYIGLDHVPHSLREWAHIPDQALGICTNGKVFHDPLGEFSRWRTDLLGYYPEDIRLKKIASRCMTIAQAGQYNFVRSLKRKEYFAARYAETQFCADVLSLLFLLNKKYPPFYKWMHRGIKGLPILGQTVHAMIADLMSTTDDQEKVNLIEKISALIIEELRKEGLTDSSSDFLLDHGPIVHSKIKDPQLGERFVLFK